MHADNHMYIYIYIYIYIHTQQNVPSRGKTKLEQTNFFSLVTRKSL